MIQSNEEKLLQNINNTLTQILEQFNNLGKKIDDLESYAATIENIEMILSNINAKTRKR